MSELIVNSLALLTAGAYKCGETPDAVLFTSQTTHTHTHPDVSVPAVLLRRAHDGTRALG